MTTTDFFAGAARLPCADWLAQINELLVKKNYGYRVKTHRARYPENTFYSQQPMTCQSELAYDLACYHPEAREHHRGHHKSQGLVSIFYMRCEPQAERILFGNMQIDDKGKRDWARKTLGRELRRKKNIYGIMIQQAVKHALSTGHKEILFQAGDACEIAQWRQKNFCQITVTEKNYALVNKIYQEEVDRFAAGPGIVIARPDSPEQSEVVIKTTPESYITRCFKAESPSLLTKIMNLNTAKAHAPGERAGIVAWRSLAETLRLIDKSAATSPVRTQPEDLQAHLSKLITALTGVVPPLDPGATAPPPKNHEAAGGSQTLKVKHVGPGIFGLT